MARRSGLVCGLRKDSPFRAESASRTAETPSARRALARLGSAASNFSTRSASRALRASNSGSEAERAASGAVWEAGGADAVRVSDDDATRSGCDEADEHALSPENPMQQIIFFIKTLSLGGQDPHREARPPYAGNPLATWAGGPFFHLVLSAHLSPASKAYKHVCPHAPLPLNIRRLPTASADRGHHCLGDGLCSRGLSRGAGPAPL